MPHKISKAQYDQLPPCPMLPGCWVHPSLREYYPWPAAERLLAGKGTTKDLDEVVTAIAASGLVGPSLARELLQPPDQL